MTARYQRRVDREEFLGTSWGEDGYGYMEYGVNLIGAGASYLIYGDSLKVTPLSLTVTGETGGPFTGNPAAITLKNVGSASLNWTATAPSWLTLAAYSGTLAAGVESPVAVAANAAAAGLAVGTYSGVITVTNATSGAIRQVTVTLVVTRRWCTPYPGCGSGLAHGRSVGSGVPQGAAPITAILSWPIQAPPSTGTILSAITGTTFPRCS